MRYSHISDEDLLNPFEGLGQLVDFPADFAKSDFGDDHGFEASGHFDNARELFVVDMGGGGRLA